MIAISADTVPRRSADCRRLPSSFLRLSKEEVRAKERVQWTLERVDEDDVHSDLMYSLSILEAIREVIINNLLIFKLKRIKQLNRLDSFSRSPVKTVKTMFKSKFLASFLAQLW